VKYKKKPVVIGAIQFVDTTARIARLSNFLGSTIKINYERIDKPTITIETLEGNMIASEGDYIIKGVNGEFYPCKPDIFEKTYERVVE
jgi:hypothetical protein